MKPLVGEGKPFHSAVDKTAALLKRKSGTGAEFMKELMGVSGVKQTELQERGLTDIMGMPKMTHEQFMAELAKKPVPAVGEKVLDVANTDDPRWMSAEERDNPPDDLTHHEQYTLPGGKRYREMLIKLPNQRAGMDEKRWELDAKLRHAPPEKRSAIMKQIDELRDKYEKTPEVFEGVGSHFGGEPGILASMRLKDRTGPNGEKLLHLEELQSDWHQQGREHGYRKQGQPERLKGEPFKMDDGTYGVRWEDGSVADLGWGRDRAERLAEEGKLTGKIPDAPLKKNWEEMALKRLIHHAAEKGYHGIVVTPGTEQADRYSLAKHIDAVEWDSKSNRLYAKQKNKSDFDKVADDVTQENLASHIGKEAAEKLLAQPFAGSYKQLSGLDLRTGDEAMKGFYDKKVPNILNSIGKKYGVKTELHGHTIDKPHPSNPSNYQIGTKPSPMPTTQLHHFPITEEMRKDVLTNGLPLYSQGGKVHMADGGDMDTMQMELMNKRMATGGRAKVTKGYVTHEPKNPHPEVGTRFKATPQGNLAKMKAFDLMKQEGKGSIVPIPYDATTRDNLVTEVSGNKLVNPLLTEAGFDYSLDPTHIAQDIGGASNSAIARRVQDRVNQAHKEHQGDVFLAPNIMGEDAENFSHHPAHIVLDLMAQRQLNSNTLQALSDDLRGQVELKRNAKTGEVTKTYPYTKFLGYHHPKMMEQVIKGGHGLETTPGNLRKKIMERLGLVNMQKLLDYNLGDLKASILDPELATDPKAYMGRTFVKAKPGAALRPSKHTSYDTDYTGTNVGGLGANRPFEILMPDVTESIYSELKARPAKTVKTPAQMRAQVIGAIEKRKEKFAQPINARVINNAGLYEEGLKQGEFDPKNVDSVLAYFQRKGGYKKGGKIKKMADGGLMNYKNIGVNEAPDMGIKAYFPPAPRSQGSVLPFGGVEQAPPAPQQPQQSPAAPQGMPQGMPQGNMPMPPQGMPMGAPPAPPPPAGNMLQMTRQGQALNALAPAPRMAPPPKMARGGQVDRDTMMLSLMNRNKR